jgi:hypothetical protein
MDEMSMLKKLATVKAPPGFEQSVMARLDLRRRSERRKRSVLRLSLAGSLASLVGAFVLLNVFVLRQKAPVVTMGKRDAAAAVSGTARRAAGGLPVPIIETFDYASEIRSLSPRPRTVYLLEQVSDTTPTGITY